MIPLPHYALLARQNTHPGLALDKFVDYKNVSAPEQFGMVDFSGRVQRPTVSAVADMPAPFSAAEFEELRKRRDMMLTALKAICVRAQTAGPLTLHLARASALENAGLCLHPIYGFAYLPGTGLKGLARAYAETVWLPTETDQLKAWRQIEDVFGWAPNQDRQKQIKDPNHPARPRRVNDEDSDSPEIKARVGDIVFHEAWPTAWPNLVEDILNSHHTKYYSAHETSVPPPGDWEEPNMVSFLSVASGVTFDFPLSNRRNDVETHVLEAAQRWLLGGLTTLGAGAKTAAGYGHFVIAKELAEEAFTLELITPAFLAGAKQQLADCELRPATLRGLLRWWWRTMHAGFLDVQTLRALEAAIWGDTKTGGAARITVRPLKNGERVEFPGKHVEENQNGKLVLRPDPAFAKANKLAARPHNKCTQGLLFLSYGMDEMPAGKPNERKLRTCVLPGATWEIVITATRDGFFRRAGFESGEEPVRISANLIRDQVRAAVCLLCQHGGVGSKGRKGFGSLVINKGMTLEQIKKTASAMREILHLAQSERLSSEISSLENMQTTGPITTPWKNYWFVLDQLGFSIQAFCQASGRKRNWVKEALGLPRKIGKSDNDGSNERGYSRTFDNQTNQEIVWLGQTHPYRGLREAKDMRHASPIHCHLARDPNGAYSIQVVAFPLSILPNADTSQEMLASLIAHLQADLASRVHSYPNSGQPPSSGPPALKPPQTEVRKFGAKVRVKILAERKKGGAVVGFDVQEDGHPQGSLSLMVGTPPNPLPKLNETINVEMHNDDPNGPQYRWPSPPKDTSKGGKPKGKNR